VVKSTIWIGRKPTNLLRKGVVQKKNTLSIENKTTISKTRESKNHGAAGKQNALARKVGEEGKGILKHMHDGTTKTGGTSARAKRRNNQNFITH